MKKAVALLLAVLLVCSLSACAKEEASAPAPSSSNKLPSSEQPSSSEPSSKPSSKPSSSEDLSSNESSEPEEETPPASIHAEHYSFATLTPLQQEYYEKLHDAVTKMQASWIVLGLAEENYRADIAVVRNALISDHPDIFWLPNFYGTAIGTSADERVAMIYFAASADSSPSYTVGRGDMERKTREMNRVIDKIVSEVTAVDPYEIELQLHDRLCALVTYSNSSDDPLVSTSYGALVNGKANCEGYSRAMQLLLSRFSILSVPVTGIAKNEGHMWNAVQLDGEWYHLDVTWNDTLAGFISHEYFNLTDSAIAVDHTFNKNFAELDPATFEESLPSFNVVRPLCKGTANNFFARTGFNLSKTNLDEFVEYMVIVAEPAWEISIADKTLRDSISADSATFVSTLNSRLAELFPDCGFKVDSVILSSSIARIYKTTVAQ